MSAVDRGIELWNKTGTNDGVRCDIGLVRHGGTAVAYAALANWSPGDHYDAARDEVLEAMNAVGQLIRKELVVPPDHRDL